MKKHTSVVASLVVTLILGLVVSAHAQIATNDYNGKKVTVSNSTGTGCPGSYKGFSAMTNSAGSIWIAPPTGATSVSIYNTSPVTNLCGITTIRNPDGVIWCTTNGPLTIPVTDSNKYQTLIYIKTTPVNTNVTYSIRAVWY